jgi:hypothetical protein
VQRFLANNDTAARTGNTEINSYQVIKLIIATVALNIKKLPSPTKVSLHTCKHTLYSKPTVIGICIFDGVCSNLLIANLNAIFMSLHFIYFWIMDIMS